MRHAARRGLADLLLAALSLLAILTAPSVVEAAGPERGAVFGEGGAPLIFRSTTDMTIIRPVLERFVERNPDLAVHYEQWASNALFDNSRAACEGEGGGDPADAVLSSAVQHMVWLVNAACGSPYVSANTAALPEARRWRDELWGITEEPAVIIYNTGAIRGQDVPRSRFALLDMMRTQPDLLRGRIATYDLAESGLGYLFAHSDSLEATSFGALLEGFARTEAVATCCSSEIIRDVAEGKFLIAYNVLGSYVTERRSPEVGVVMPEDYTLVLSRAYMIPRQARQKEAAARLLDFLLSPEARKILTKIGLVAHMDPAETGLPLSARRAIALSPSLLVAMDRHRRDRLLSLWEGAFVPPFRP